jgi:monoamine oxidase
MTQHCEVAIIGAGLAGLMAARTLVAEGKDVLVLEAQNRVGGRILNHQLGQGQALELGGQWLGPTQEKMYALCQELSLETYPTYNCGDQLVSLAGQTLRLKANENVTSVFPAYISLEITEVIERLETMAQGLNGDAPHHHPQTETWSYQSLEAWLEQHSQYKQTQDYLALEFRGIFAAEAEDISLLHTLLKLQSGGGFDNLINVHQGAQQDRILGGSQLVAERMAETLGERLILSTPVRKIVQDERGVAVIADTLTVQAERVIITLPLTLANRIVYEPELPSSRHKLAEHVVMGSVIKVMVIYDQPFWRDEGLSGQVLSDSGPINTIYDNSPYDGRYGVLLGFIEGKQAKHLRCLGRDVRESLTIECLQKFFGPRANEYQTYLEKNWLTDPWTQGGYCEYMKPGDYNQTLSEPCGRIHWAGTETSRFWNGYMEGAVLSGERAAYEVLALLS